MAKVWLFVDVNENSYSKHMKGEVLRSNMKQHAEPEVQEVVPASHLPHPDTDDCFVAQKPVLG